MKEKSIAILTWTLKGGSLTNYTTALTQGLWDAGAKNLYLFYVNDGLGSHVTVPEGVHLVPLGAKRSRWMPFYLARCLREIKPDFLIAVSTFISLPAVIGWLLSGQRSTKLIVSEHSTMSYKVYVELKDDPMVKIQPFLARLLYPMATGLHANSQVVLDDLINTIGVSMPPERAIATTNPVNIDAIARYSQAEPDHPWLRHKDKPVIISVARLAQQKNFPLLLKAFASVKQQVDARLIIVGEGPERPHLEQLAAQLGIEQDVSLPGFSSNPWCYMANADVFVLSSEEEPFGLVLVEAMVCGVPVIATDAIGQGPKSVLEDGKHGILIPSEDEAALTEAIAKLLTVPELRDQLIAAGKQRCQAFQPKLVAQQWLSFLSRLQAL